MRVFWPRREFAVLISRGCGLKSRPRVDIKFLSCARSPSLLSPFGKMSTDFWWQGVIHMELGLKILVYVLCKLVDDSDCTCPRVEADIRRATSKQYTHAHTDIAYG